MAEGDIHTSKQGDRWVNKAEGDQHASNSALTKAEAQATGREIAIDRGVEHIIHNQDGRIGRANAYRAANNPRVEGLTDDDELTADVAWPTCWSPPNGHVARVFDLRTSAGELRMGRVRGRGAVPQPGTRLPPSAFLDRPLPDQPGRLRDGHLGVQGRLHGGPTP